VVAYPGAQVTVGTEVLSTIISMPAGEKKVVRKGDLLAELRADDVNASLREAHLRVIEAETGLRLLRARFQLDRIFPSPTGRAPQMDSRQEEQTAAVARRDAAKAAVDRLEAEVAKYRITAPIDGVVIARHAEPGETVTPGARLVTIVNLGRLRVEAEVDEFDIPGIALAAKATITAEGFTGQSWRGEVEEVPDAIVARQTRPDDPGRPGDTRALRLKIAFREANPLKLGQHVEVDIVAANRRK
jgi:RND family efflux transporter MFP subunit